MGDELNEHLFFFLALCTCSHASCSLSCARRCFRKNEKKIKQCLTVQARFNYTAQSQDQIPDHSDQINYF